MFWWVLFWSIVVLSFIAPGGILFVLFWGLILTPLWVVLGLVVSYLKALFRK